MERRMDRSRRRPSNRDKQIMAEMSTRAMAQEKKIKDLQREISQMEEVQAEQDTALLLATQFQKRAHEDRLNLRDIISVRDARIATLSNQLVEAQNTTAELTGNIYSITHAHSWDAKTGAALEAQAQVHLALVQNLKADLSDREASIVALKGDLGSQKQGRALEIDGLRQDLDKAAVENKQLKADAVDNGERSVKEKQSLEAALAKAAEYQQVAQDQQELIKRLMSQE